MVGENKKDINIIRNRIECIENGCRKGRKWKGLSTPPKCNCQVKRKRTINMIDLTLEQHVELLLENFNVPNTRRNVEKKTNVRWLLRNLRIDNKDNPHLKHVSACLKAILTKEQLR
jgi:hypothetical protein